LDVCFQLWSNQNVKIMKEKVFKFGLYSGVILFVIPLITFYAMGGASGGPEGYAASEVIGYLTIIASMIFVFLGIKSFRDNENNGKLTFIEALKMGSLIVLFPAIAFTLYNWFYVEVLDPDFVNKYYDYQLGKMKAAADPSEYAAVEASMASQKEMYANVGFQSFVMFATVYVIGFIITVLSGIILRKSN